MFWSLKSSLMSFQHHDGNVENYKVFSGSAFDLMEIFKAGLMK